MEYLRLAALPVLLPIRSVCFGLKLARNVRQSGIRPHGTLYAAVAIKNAAVCVATKMAKISDRQVEALLPMVKNEQVSIDDKMTKLNDLKSLIKHFNVPEHLIPRLFDVCRASMEVDALVSTGASTMTHLMKRVSLQSPAQIKPQLPMTAPILTIHIGNDKERIRTMSSQCFADFWRASPAEVEHNISDIINTGKPQAKTQGCLWISAQIEQGLEFQQFVPSLLELLKDNNEAVTDAAKATLAVCLQKLPAQDQPTFATKIAAVYAPRKVTPKSEVSRRMVSKHEPSNPEPAQAESSKPESTKTESLKTESFKVETSKPSTFKPEAAKPAPSRQVASKPKSSVASPKRDAVSEAPTSPVVYDGPTAKEINDHFQGWNEYFGNKESELNWNHRQKLCDRVCSLLKEGPFPKSTTAAFVKCFREHADHINQAISSLRTTLSTAGFEVVQTVASELPVAIDGIADIVLPCLIQQCGSTKTPTRIKGNEAITNVFIHATYHANFMTLIGSQFEFNKLHLSTSIPLWAATLVKHHKTAIERTGLDKLETVIQKGLTNAGKPVRDNARECFYTYATAWRASGKKFVHGADMKIVRFLREAVPETLADIFNEELPDKKAPPRPSIRELAAQRRAAVKSEPIVARTTPAPRAVPTAAIVVAPSASITGAPLRPAKSRVAPVMAENIKPETTKEVVIPPAATTASTSFQPKRFNEDRSAQSPPQSAPQAYPQNFTLAGCLRRLSDRTINIFILRRISSPVAGTSEALQDPQQVKLLLTSLLAYVTSPASEFPTSFDAKSVIDHKSQAFVCVRHLLHHQRDVIITCCDIIISAILTVRDELPASSHLVAALEMDSREIVHSAPIDELPSILLAVLDTMDTGAPGAGAPRIKMGIEIASAIIRRLSTESEIPARFDRPLATFIRHSFAEEKIFFRRNILPFFGLLDEVLKERLEFWGLLDSLPEEQRRLFVHYKEA